MLDRSFLTFAGLVAGTLTGVARDAFGPFNPDESPKSMRNDGNRNSTSAHLEEFQGEEKSKYYLPSIEEIVAACKKIRAKWSRDEQRRRRAGASGGDYVEFE